MKMFDMNGAVLMDVASLERRGDDLVMKGKMMGTMPATIFIKPEEIWKAKSLLSWSILWYLPIIVIKGWLRSLKS